MQFFFSFILILFLQNCSFDNKTGIWKSEKFVENKKNNAFDKFEMVSSSNPSFNKIKKLSEGIKINLSPSVKNKNWKDIFFDKTNNFSNFKYADQNQLVYKSKKITRSEISPYILAEENNIIISDFNGNLYVYSINQNRIISKFNFYKKKYKNIKKNLNFVVENRIIYVGDNLGYLYAYSYEENRILWAKNYKIPFRSNIKISDNKLITSNQNNNLFFFNKKNGNSLKLIPTEENTIKNNFINNISLTEDSVFFLNSYGSLYSIDIKKMNIKWFLNLNQSLDINPSSLFEGSEVVSYKNRLIVSSNSNTYILDTQNGSIINKFNFSSIIKPSVQNNFVFLISKNNFFIAINIQDGKILYSYNIDQQVSKFLDIKQKKTFIKNLAILNDQIYIFLENSYVINYFSYGQINQIRRLPNKISSMPIFLENSVIYLSKKKKIIVIN